MKSNKDPFLYRNGLSILLLALMLIFLAGQLLTGWNEWNEKLTSTNHDTISFIAYLHSGHCIQATFENWESEFLQMAAYVLFTVSLRQKGSSESKPLHQKVDVDKEPRAHANAPWPVKKGGWWLKLYSHSLSIAFGLLFLMSFLLHFYGSLKNFNEEQALKNLPLTDTWSYLGSSRFWFESFQNWQSEFLAVASIVLLSIWFREKGSPESKPVDASYGETGKYE